MAEAGDLVASDLALGGPDGALAQAVALLGPDDVLEVADELPSVHADEVALRQLFANLVGNAVKYARPGVPAVVRVRAERHGPRVIVEVEDNGVGVDERERVLIFQRFHRSDTVRAGFRGNGMGLSICQTIVHRHGGTIECLAADPRPRVGLPLRPARGHLGGRARDAAADGARRPQPRLSARPSDVAAVLPARPRRTPRSPAGASRPAPRPSAPRRRCRRRSRRP